MSSRVNPIPQGYHTVTPYLIINGALKAIDFYKQAFNAKILMRSDTIEGKLLHATIKIGDSIIMLSDEFPKSSECGMVCPDKIHGSTVMLSLYVDDVDQAFEQAVSAGAKVRMPLADMFWGDRYGQIIDPFGHLWSLASKKEDLTEEQVKERAAKFFCHE